MRDRLCKSPSGCSAIGLCSHYDTLHQQAKEVVIDGEKVLALQHTEFKLWARRGHALEIHMSTSPCSGGK